MIVFCPNTNASHISLSQQLTLRRLPRTSDQMHPSITSGIKNDQKHHNKYSMNGMILKKNPVHSEWFKWTIFTEEFKFHKECSLR